MNVLRIFLLPSKVMHRLYNWTLGWAKTKYAQTSLFLLAFAESSFFPVPPDVLLIAMTVADRFKWWRYALITTIGSVLGGVLGYYIGLTFFETVGKQIIEFYHLGKYFEIVQVKYEQNALLAVFTAAFTPIPFKVFTIAGGVFQIPLSSLIIGSVVGRAGRFFAVALALRIFGKRIADTIDKYFDLFSILFVLLIAGGFVVLKLI